MTSPAAGQKQFNFRKAHFSHTRCSVIFHFLCSQRALLEIIYILPSSHASAVLLQVVPNYSTIVAPPLTALTQKHRCTAFRWKHKVGAEL